VFAHLFDKDPRPGDIEVTLRISSQAASCHHQSNHSKVETNPLSTRPSRTQQANLPAYTPTNLSMKNV